MNKLCLTKRAIVRFRRWIRKAYAAFCSVGRCVTIGFLKKGIADASLVKNKSKVSVVQADRREECRPDKDDGSSETMTGLMLFLTKLYEFMVQPQQVVEGFFCDITYIIYTLNRRTV